MNAIDRIKSIQTILQVTADGQFGPKSQAALESLKAASKTAPDPVPAIPPTLSEQQNDSGGAEGSVDARSEGNIATLHPKLQPLARKVVQNAAAIGITIKITSGLRTYKEQDELYAQGRTKPGKIVTGARGGFSSHNFATAFDFTLFDGKGPVWESPNYAKVAAIGKSLGLSAGIDWSKPDEPHLYLKPPFSKNLSEAEMMAELRRRHDKGIDPFV